MNCNLGRSHGRLMDLSLLFIVLASRNFVSGICKLKSKKAKNVNIFVKKTWLFPATTPHNATALRTPVAQHCMLNKFYKFSKY